MKFDPQNPENYALELAAAKARAGIAPENALVLGCDTIVIHDGELLEKPVDEIQAAEYLRRLSDDWHTVITAIALEDRGKGRIESAFEATDVRFGPLSDEEIRAYVGSGEPMDKAGGYGIQEKGALLVRELRGDYFNVVGLPLFRLTVCLGRLNFPLIRILRGN